MYKQEKRQRGSILQLQKVRLETKASRASYDQDMLKRAERMPRSLQALGDQDRAAQLKLPDPDPCGKTPLMASNLSKSFGSVEIFTAVDLAIDKGNKVVVIDLNGAGKTTLLRILAGEEIPHIGLLEPGHELKIGYFAQEHETLDVNKSVLENMQYSAPQLVGTDARKVLGSFLFIGYAVDKPAIEVSGGGKTGLAMAILVVSGATFFT